MLLCGGLEKRRVTLESRCQHESAARACLFLNCIQAPLRTRLRTFAKTGLENSGHDEVVDRILCVWFCGPKKTFVFGSQKRSIREGLRDIFKTVCYFRNRAAGSRILDIYNCRQLVFVRWRAADGGSLRHLERGGSPLFGAVKNGMSHSLIMLAL